MIPYIILQAYNETATVDESGWMGNNTNVSVESVSDFIGRTGSYVIGTDPSNPAAGAVLTGLLVGFLALNVVGTARAGVVGGAVAAVAVVAVLSDSLSLAPTWLYPVVLMLVGFMAAVAYIRWIR